MDERKFTSFIGRARLFDGDYALGYRRGLRRLYHGGRFGTEEEHEQFMRLGLDGDPREELGCGYRDGFAGKAPDLPE